MRYRDMAYMTGIQFPFDFRQLPAIAEDVLVEAINRKDESVVVHGTRQKDPFTDSFYRSGG